MANTNKKGVIYYLENIWDAVKDLSSSVITSQSDWAEDDEASPKYIANKPTIPTAVKAIALEGLPSSDTNTVSLLNATGITAAEVKAVTDGYRTGLEKDGVFYKVDGASYTSATVYSISFSNASYELESTALVPVAGSVFYSVSRSGDTVTCAAVTIS